MLWNVAIILVISVMIAGFCLMRKFTAHAYVYCAYPKLPENLVSAETACLNKGLFCRYTVFNTIINILYTAMYYVLCTMYQANSSEQGTLRCFIVYALYCPHLI